MTDLTEQWKKGELSEAWYYVKDIHNKESLDRYFKETDNFEYLEDWEVGEVIAPVPSYDEWQKLKEFADYLIHNRDELTRQINFWMQENTKLKELLARAKGILTVYRISGNQSTYSQQEIHDTITKIDEVLK